MPKKTGAKEVQAVEERREVKAVRLELPPEDYERLERCAKRRGLNKASYSRMAVLALIEQDEAGKPK
jgi:predicted DNA-binding protein